MGLVFIDGFNHYEGTQLDDKWDDSNSSVEVDTSPVRTGQGSYRCANASAFIRKFFPTTDYVVGMAIRVGAISPAYELTDFENLFGWRSVDHLHQITVQFRPCEKVIRVIGGDPNAPAWTSANSAKINLGQGFYYFELAVDLGAPSWELRQDGVNILSGTDDIIQPGTSTLSWLYLGQLADVSYDDVYVLDEDTSYPGAGSENQDFLGPCSIYTLWPIGNGPDSDWVGSDGNSVNNFQLVDDNLNAVGTPNGDTDYVTSGTTGAQDTYQHSNTVLPSGQAVFGVQIVSMARRAGLAALNFKHVIKDSGDTWESEGENTLTVGDGTYSFPTNVWDQDPNNATPQDWTKALVESRRYGVEIA